MNTMFTKAFLSVCNNSVYVDYERCKYIEALRADAM